MGFKLGRLCVSWTGTSHFNTHNNKNSCFRSVLHIIIQVVFFVLFLKTQLARLSSITLNIHCQEKQYHQEIKFS